jgi:hypothetical protein
MLIIAPAISLLMPLKVQNIWKYLLTSTKFRLEEVPSTVLQMLPHAVATVSIRKIFLLAMVNFPQSRLLHRRVKLKKVHLMNSSKRPPSRDPRDTSTVSRRETTL